MPKELRMRMMMMKMETPKSILTQSWKTVQMTMSTEKGMKKNTVSLPI